MAYEEWLQPMQSSVTLHDTYHTGKVNYNMIVIYAINAQEKSDFHNEKRIFFFFFFLNLTTNRVIEMLPLSWQKGKVKSSSAVKEEGLLLPSEAEITS